MAIIVKRAVAVESIPPSVEMLIIALCLVMLFALLLILADIACDFRISDAIAERFSRHGRSRPDGSSHRH